MKSPVLLLAFVVAVVLPDQSASASSDQLAPAACDNRIYCTPNQGSLLHTVQMAKLYKDSKTFVDKPMKHPPKVVLDNFAAFMRETGDNPNKEQVQTFVDANFDAEGTEFQPWQPSDWKENPAFLDKIQDADYRSFAEDIHRRWKRLGRQIRPSLKQVSSAASSDDDKTTSLIYLDKPFVVPGGRFREMYYWDSYWTILGLLQSEMKQTTLGMLDNFAQLVNTYGFIPNGNRLYYTRRTQPPLFIPMVDEYYKTSGKDKSVIERFIEPMEREMQFWLDERVIPVSLADAADAAAAKKYRLAVYDVRVDGPRPESYSEDYELAQEFHDAEERSEFYRNIKAGAESGWDYSTKWFIDPSTGEPSSKLGDIQTRHIVPVELNAYLCRNSRLLMSFNEELGRRAQADKYREIGQQFQEAIDAVLWDEEEGVWFDFDTINSKMRKLFFPSNVAPLWAECYPQSRLKEKVKKVVKYLRNNKAWSYPGGVPTSLVDSGEQWDFSNAWAPLQDLIITGLERTRDPEAKDLALDLTRRWVKQNWLVYSQRNHSMFEKYDATESGKPGGDGEYSVQEGFGWTNGVILSLLNKYGDQISSEDQISLAGNSNPSPILMLILILVAAATSYKY